MLAGTVLTAEVRVERHVEIPGQVAGCNPGLHHSGDLQVAEQYLDVPIHLRGQDVSGLPFPGYLSELYNSHRVGFSMSMTNVSLIPCLSLACGVTAVVNDAKHNRRVPNNIFIGWSAPTPTAFAETRSSAYVGADAQLAENASRRVLGALSRDAPAVVTRCIERVVAEDGRDDF
jgi:hypothetical protein